MRNVLFVFILATITNSIVAQQWTISGGLLVGKVLKHKEEIIFDVPPLSSALIISGTNHTNGQKAWQRYWGKPRIELNAVFLNFGNRDVLGNAYGLIPGYAFYLKRFQKIDFLIHIGMGVGYLTKKFDVQDNPENNAIGSHLNNATRFRLSGVYRLNRKWRIEAGFNFIHFSNALSSSPNTGINVYGPDISLLYNINPNEVKDVPGELYDSTAFKKWRWNFQVGYANKEIAIPGGPKFSIYTISNAAVYHLSPFLRIYLGYEYEYNNSSYFEEYFILEDEETARKTAKKHVVFTAAEALLGKTGFRVQIGHYPGRGLLQNSEVFYFKLNLNVYGNALFKDRMKPYIGILLKSHFAVAEYFAIVGGVDF
jgi:hypothetical protein